MVRTQSVRVRSAFVLMIALCYQAGDLPAAGPDLPQGRVTRFDIATRGDLLFAYMVSPLIRGDVTDWTILGGLPGKVGDWVTRYADAQNIANIITSAFSIEGQPLARLDRLVAECAGTLGVDRPAIYVRNDPDTRIYIVRAYNRDHLVLTSGLLKLFEKRPGELKFVVGRELGRVLCGHLELRKNSYGLLSALQAINVVVVPDKFQDVLPTLALGRLFTWCRESEFSADRAGLLCCGEPKVAYEAIMRLQHGLDPDSIWIDPEKGFEPEVVIKNFQQWQYRPFVQFLLDLKRQQLENPYVPERLAMLKTWVDTGAYREILGRDAVKDEGQLIEVVKIQAFELAPEGKTVDPYVIVLDGGQQVLRTVAVSGAREAEWRGFKSTDKGVDQPRSFRDGGPLFCEIWDSDYLNDAFIGGLVVYPHGRDATTDKDSNRVAAYTAKIQWDWKSSQAISRPGYARVFVRFLGREADQGIGAENVGRAER